MKFKTKYVFKEFFVNFIFSFSIIFFIFTIRSIFQLVDLIVKGSFTLFPLLKFFFFSIGISFQIVIPLVILTSSMSFFSTLTSDRELHIFAFSGIPNKLLIKPLFIFSIIFTLFLFYFNFFTVPEMEYQKRNITTILKIKNPLSVLIEKETIKDFPNVSIYIEKIYRNFTLKNISITKREKDTTIFLKAEKGRAVYNPDKNKLLFILENGNFLITTQNSVNSVNFQNYKFFIDLPESFKKIEIEPTIYELNYIELRRIKNIESSIEFHKRIVFSITPLILLFLGSSIGMNLEQKNKILYIGIGGFISIIFFEMLTLGEIITRKTGNMIFVYIPVVILIILAKRFWK